MCCPSMHLLIFTLVRHNNILISNDRYNHMDDHIVDKTPIANDQLKLVSGQVVFEEENTRVSEMSLCPGNFTRMLTRSASVLQLFCLRARALVNKRSTAQWLA